MENTIKIKQKLYYIISGRFPTEKAYGNQVSQMCHEFSKLGLDVTLVFPNRKNTISEPWGKYYGVPEDFSVLALNSIEFDRSNCLFPRLAFYVEQLHYLYKIAIYKFSDDSVIYTRRPEIAWWFSRKKFKVVYESHEWSDRMVWLLRFFMSKVKNIVTTNNYIAEAFKSHGIDKPKFHIAPNGVDLEVFAIGETKDEAYEKLISTFDLSRTKDKKILLYTGNYKTMGVDKGISDILKSFQSLEEDFHFIAVGGTQDYIDEYDQLAKDLGVSDRVHLFGRVNKSQIALFQRYADVMLMPFPKKAHYEYYMSPLKTFEYMASGRPIVATRLPSIMEILDDNNAFLINPDSPSEIAEVIKNIIDDPSLATSKVNQANEAVQQYTWQNRARSIANIFHEGNF